MKNLTLTFCFALAGFAILAQEHASLEKSAQAVKARSTHIDMNKLRAKSSGMLKQLILDKFNYPEWLLENGIDGLVKLEVTTTKKGDVARVKFLDSPHPMLNDSLEYFILTSSPEQISFVEKEFKFRLSIKYTIKPL